MVNKAFVLYIIFLLTVEAQNIVGDKTVSLDGGIQPLRSVLEALSRQTGAEFVYQDDLVNEVGISCNIKEQPLNLSLTKLLANTEIEYKQYGNSSYILFKKRKPKIEDIRAVLVEDNYVAQDTMYSLIKPRLLSKTNLIYPPEAVKDNFSGNVKLRLLIDPMGRVIKSFVDSSSGSFLLDSASVSYSKGMKFTPALANGKPHGIWLTMRFEFQIISDTE